MPGLFDGTPLQRPVTCERCSQPLAACACPCTASGEVCTPADQSPRVRREKRRGKWVAVVGGLDPAATDLKALLKDLRTHLAAGGGLGKDATDPNGAAQPGAEQLVIQGDHQQAIVQRLITMGYKAKPSGG